MIQLRILNVAIAFALAGIGVAVLTTIWSGTRLSATTQLVLFFIGIACFVAAVFAYGHIQVALGQALVVSGRGDPEVLQGSTFLFSSPLQKNTCLVPLTPKWLQISFDKPPYPLTLDGLPVTVKIRAKVAVDDKKDAIIEAARILGDKGHYAFYEEEGNKTLEGFIATVLSEGSYHDHTDNRKIFVKNVKERWDKSATLNLREIHLDDLHQISIEEAKLSGIDCERAESAEKEFQAQIAEKNAGYEEEKTDSDAKSSEAKEKLQRIQDSQKEKTKRLKLWREEKEKRIKSALQHKANILIIENNKRLSEKRIDAEKKRRDFVKEEAETNETVKISEAKAAFEVEKINNSILEDRVNNQLKLEKQSLEIREKELGILDKNKGGDLRYQLAKEAISMSTEQSKALATALSNARMIGSIDDLPLLEKMLKTPIAIREVLGEFLGVMDDDLVHGIGRFFKGVAAARKEAHSSGPTSSNSNTTSSSTSGGSETPPPNDSNFEN